MQKTLMGFNCQDGHPYEKVRLLYLYCDNVAARLLQPYSGNLVTTVITSAKEVLFLSALVCLSVCLFVC